MEDNQTRIIEQVKWKRMVENVLGKERRKEDGGRLDGRKEIKEKEETKEKNEQKGAREERVKKKQGNREKRGRKAGDSLRGVPKKNERPGT